MYDQNVMTGPTLLVHDDIANIATLRRLLGREGHDVFLATSVADAVTAFQHHAPSLIVLAPAVEDNRGKEFLEELAHSPEGRATRLLLLGRAVAGFVAPVVPLPLEGDVFLDKVREAVAGGPNWDVTETILGPTTQVEVPSEISSEEVEFPSDENPWETAENPVPAQKYYSAAQEMVSPIPLPPDPVIQVAHEEFNAQMARDAVVRAAQVAELAQQQRPEPAPVVVPPPMILAPPPPAAESVSEPSPPPVVIAPPPIAAVPEPVATPAKVAKPKPRPPASKLPLSPEAAALEETLQQFQEANYFEMLRVPTSAAKEEIQKAFSALASEYSPLKYVGHGDPLVVRKVEQIHGLIKEAAEALANDELRAAYAAHLPGETSAS